MLPVSEIIAPTMVMLMMVAIPMSIAHTAIFRPPPVLPRG
jgi:hypothetical protein